MPQQRTLSPFQFSLRWLFFATLVVAILAWLTTVLEGDVWYLLVMPTLPLVAMSASILGIIYLREGWRAFWVGYGVCLMQVVLLALFFEAFDFHRPFGDFEVLVLIPPFVVALPALTGWIGYRFYRNGQSYSMVPPVQPDAARSGQIEQPA